MIINKTTAAAIAVVLVFVGTGYFLFHMRSVRNVSSFQECAGAGYPILQTYPAQCKTPDGRTFTNSEEQLQSGITGTVLLGPTCPVQRVPPDPRCTDKPFQITLVATRNGSTVRTFSSDENGRFTVALPPGEYVIQPAATAHPFPRCANSSIIQVAGREFTQTVIHCDTGIR